MTGSISKVISDKGFGFIQGQSIVFDAGRGDKGLRAENVRVS